MLSACSLTRHSLLETKRACKRLKGLITEDRLSFESKGMNPVMALNTLHILMATNETWAAPVGTEQERRFAVFEVNNKYQQNEVFFGGLHDQLDNGGREAFLHLLMNRDISGWHPRSDIPKTKALQEQSDQSRTTLEEFIFTALDTADPGLWSPYHDEWDADGQVRCLIPVFEDAYRTFAKTMGERQYTDTAGAQGIGRSLKLIFKGRADNEEVVVGPGRLRAHPVKTPLCPHLPVAETVSSDMGDASRSQTRLGGGYRRHD